MKSLIAAIGLLLMAGITNHLSAASRFWISGSASNWNNPANWSASTGGPGGASVPAGSDIANFDNGGTGNCTLDIPVSLSALTIAAGYSGTISQGGNVLTVFNSASFSGGFFAGGSANISIIGVYTLSGTVFTSTTATLEFRSSTAFSSGSFLHNNGTVRYNAGGSTTLTGTPPVFYTLEFSGNGQLYTLATTGNLTVMNSLNLTGSLFYNLASGGILGIDVKGDVNSTNTATGCGGDAMININGTGTQNFNGSSVAGGGALPQLTINKLSGVLNLSNYPGVSNNFTYTAGALSPGSSTFCFNHGNVGSYNISGSLALANIAFAVNTSLLTVNVTAATTLTATGDLSMTGAGNLVINTGNINANGNLLLTNTGTTGGGSAIISINGSGAQNIDGTTIVMNQSRLPVININKPAGTLNLLGNISFASNVLYTAGTLNPGVSTCYLVASLSMSGVFSLYNITLTAGNNMVITVTAGSTITATHTLDMENGSNYININTGTLAVQGNLIDNNTGLTGGGTGTILFNGTGDQSISSTGIIDQGRLPGVNINKASGTLTLPALITIRGDWTYQAGALDISSNNSTVVFENNINITGTHTLNNIVFDGSNNYTFSTGPTTTLTVSGNIGMIGTGNITLNGGTINLLGNLSLANTGGGGGTSVIAFTGATAQAILSSLSVNQNCLPSVTIAKTGGTLSFPALITVKGNWVYASGTLDVNTNNSTVVFASPLGTGLFGLSGTHTLNNVTFQAFNNNTGTVSTGTVLTVSGTLNFTGTANVFINTPIAGSTAILALGDIIINNTGTGGGGTGLILVAGTGSQTLASTVASGQGFMPYLKIQKPSGSLTLSGVISESRDWNYSSGTVDASTNASTVVFGINNLSISSAGMSFHHLTVVSGTSSLANTLSVNGNLTINGTGVLAAGSNSINLLGNWNNRATAGFTEATGTVNFNGSTLQTIASPGGENFTGLTLNNSGPGVQMMNNIAVANTLGMTQGNMDLNGSNLTLGTSAVNNGTLIRTAGTLINTGSFTRWFKSAIIPAGSVNGLFPVGTATDYRPVFVSAPVAGPSAGGTLALAYSDAASNSAVSISDGLFTVTLRKDLKWTMVPGAGLTGGLYNLQVQGTQYGLIGATSDLRITLAGAVVGTAGINGGSTANPQVNRVGLLVADLNNSFYLGSVNPISTPLPVSLIYFTASPRGQTVNIRWETVSETQNDYFTILRSRDAIHWDSLTRVDGAGNTSNNTRYAFDDIHPYEGRSYYRLKNTNVDGQYQLSPIRIVDRGHPDNGFILYPNPAINTLTISGNSDQPGSIRMINSTGQLVLTANLAGPSQTLNISQLPPGTYFVQRLQGGISETKTMLIHKK